MFLMLSGAADMWIFLVVYNIFSWLANFYLHVLWIYCLFLQIMAIDQFAGVGSLNTTTTLKITIQDINDNQPHLSQDQYEFSVAENVPYGTLVGVVMATDADAPPNNKLLYTIVDGDIGMFFIDTSTGKL